MRDSWITSLKPVGIQFTEFGTQKRGAMGHGDATVIPGRPMGSPFNRQLRSIDRHPVSLWRGKQWRVRGAPRLAEPVSRSETPDRMRQLSRQVGTNIGVANGIRNVALDQLSA